MVDYQKVTVLVPKIECWRMLFCCNLLTFWIPPKRVRVMNDMARKGWQYLGVGTSIDDAYTALVFSRIAGLTG